MMNSGKEPGGSHFSNDPDREGLNKNLDPEFVVILNHAREIQRFLDNLAPKQCSENEGISVLVGKLNTIWRETGWPGTKVKVSGKFEINTDITGAVSEDFIGIPGVRQYQDSRGEQYFIANDAEFVCSNFSWFKDKDNRVRIGLTLALKDRYDSNYDEIFDGQAVMFPDDINMARFEHPSLTAIEEELETLYPSVYNIIKSAIAETPVPDDMITDVLSRISIPKESLWGSDIEELKNRIERYINYRIGFDSDRYTIGVDGEVWGLDHCEEFIKREQPYVGDVQGCNLRIVLDDDPDDEKSDYRLGLLASVPLPDMYTGYLAIKLPAGSIKFVVNARPTNCLPDYLPGIATYVNPAEGIAVATGLPTDPGGDKEDKGEWGHDKPNADPVGKAEQGRMSDAVFLALMKSLGVNPDSYDYMKKAIFDLNLKCYIAPIDDEIRQMIASSREEEAMNNVDVLQPGDDLVISGEVTIYEFDEATSSHEALALNFSNGFVLRGVYLNHIVTDVPDLDRSKGKNIVYKKSTVIQLGDVFTVNGTDKKTGYILGTEKIFFVDATGAGDTINFFKAL